MKLGQVPPSLAAGQNLRKRGSKCVCLGRGGDVEPMIGLAAQCGVCCRSFPNDRGPRGSPSAGFCVAWKALPRVCESERHGGPPDAEAPTPAPAWLPSASAAPLTLPHRTGDVARGHHDREGARNRSADNRYRSGLLALAQLERDRVADVDQLAAVAHLDHELVAASR
jgi:hypothetical protein